MLPHAIGADGGPREILGIFDRDAQRGHQGDNGSRGAESDRESDGSGM